MYLLKPSKKQLDGAVVPIDLLLGTFTAVTITKVQFDLFARLVVCATKRVQQELMNARYQFSDPAPAGVLLEVASNVYWSEFDLTAPEPKPAHRAYWLHPQKWAPVQLQSKTGVLHCILEARCGNKKHPAEIEIRLYTDEETKSTSQA